MTQNHSEGDRRAFSLWRAFSSIKLTLFLLVLLAVTATFGTLIPQQESAMELADRLSPTLVKLLATLQLFDLYHSWWFRLIIGALAVNLIVCSIDRFPASLKRFRFSPKAGREKLFENPVPGRRFTVKGPFDRVSMLLEGELKRQYRKTEKKDGDQATYYFVQKGRTSYFGVYLVHLSVLLILAGGIVGSLFGFEGFVNILEGEGVNKALLRKSRVSRPLPFTVRCDKFTVEFYPNGTPREYRSDLVFLANGETAYQGPLRVNHPITFQGITFYQSSYGTIPGKKARLSLKSENPEGNVMIEAETNKPFPLPGKEAEAAITEMRSDFMRMGPAVLLMIRPRAGDEVQFWVFKNHTMIEERFRGLFERFPKFNPSSYKPYTFFLESMESRYYTGLQVSRDPGVVLVWIGFVAIMVGLFVTFFLSHRSIWIRLSQDKNGAQIAVAGTSNKNTVALERELDKLALVLQRKMGGGSSS